MSDDVQTYSWQVESKNGVSTRVDDVAFVNVGQDPNRIEDYFELTGSDGRAMFITTLSSLSFAKRVEARGVNSTSTEDAAREALARASHGQCQCRS